MGDTGRAEGGSVPQLKSIRKEAVPAALQKAERYRLINDPWSAESICLDVLSVDPENQQALIALLLAYTDEMSEQPSEGLRLQRGLTRLNGDHKRAYYAGIICEPAPRCNSTAARRERRWPTSGCARPWTGMSAPRRSGHRRTTSRSSAGTPARGCWSGALM
jgi:hypothetical protein